MARTRRITQFSVRGLKRRITIFDGSKLVCRITQFPVRGLKPDFVKILHAFWILVVLPDFVIS